MIPNKITNLPSYTKWGWAVHLQLFNEQMVSFPNYYMSKVEEKKTNQPSIPITCHFSLQSTQIGRVNEYVSVCCAVWRVSSHFGVKCNTITCNYFDKRTKVVEGKIQFRIEIKLFLLSCRFIGTVTAATVAAAAATARGLKLKYAHLTKFHVVIVNDDEEKLLALEIIRPMIDAFVMSEWIRGRFTTSKILNCEFSLSFPIAQFITHTHDGSCSNCGQAVVIVINEIGAHVSLMYHFQRKPVSFHRQCVERRHFSHFLRLFYEICRN